VRVSGCVRGGSCRRRAHGGPVCVCVRWRRAELGVHRTRSVHLRAPTKVAQRTGLQLSRRGSETKFKSLGLPNVRIPCMRPAASRTESSRRRHSHSTKTHIERTDFERILTSIASRGAYSAAATRTCLQLSLLNRSTLPWWLRIRRRPMRMTARPIDRRICACS
jgi:hypothetical protein